MKIKGLSNYSDENIILELKRVASELKKTLLTRKDIDKHSRISASLLVRRFGSVDKALELAGLESSRHFKYSKEDLLNEIYKVWEKLGRQPFAKEIRSVGGKYSQNTYLRYFGSWFKALEEFIDWKNKQQVKPTKDEPISILTPTQTRSSRKKRTIEYGEPIDFLGLRHAPINEQGVVYLFGILSKSLGITVEAIRSNFPDCEAKREIPDRPGRWESVTIEFEFRSSNFLEHNHNTDECDLIVCWEHEWDECPLEVISLKDIMNKLKNK